MSREHRVSDCHVDASQRRDVQLDTTNHGDAPMSKSKKKTTTTTKTDADQPAAPPMKKGGYKVKQTYWLTTNP